MTRCQETQPRNSVLCRSLGLDGDTYDRPLSDSEANGVPLSPEEAEIAIFMARGMGFSIGRISVCTQQPQEQA
ncbi:MAG: hypothetical protein IE917_10755 [Betaproteobacteria bacterium]|nr:hypothetical protein [Betaproteobacteria bacterium]